MEFLFFSPNSNKNRSNVVEVFTLFVTNKLSKR